MAPPPSLPPLWTRWWVGAVIVAMICGVVALSWLQYTALETPTRPPVADADAVGAPVLSPVPAGTGADDAESGAPGTTRQQRGSATTDAPRADREDGSSDLADRADRADGRSDNRADDRTDRADEPTRGASRRTPPAAGAVPELRFEASPVRYDEAPLNARERAITRSVMSAARVLLVNPPSSPPPGIAAPWVLPVSGYRLTARFGESGSYWSSTHTGLDFAAPTGTPVVSVDAGVVTFAGSAGAYGYKVEVRHPDGSETWYAHLSRVDVAVGDTPARGQGLGAVGATGNVTGPHLHLEVRTPAGEPVDPAEALAARGAQV